MAAILLAEEIKRKRKEDEGQTTSLKMRTSYGVTPLFCTKSSEAVELFLQMGDLNLTDVVGKIKKGLQPSRTARSGNQINCSLISCEASCQISLHLEKDVLCCGDVHLWESYLRK